MIGVRNTTRSRVNETRLRRAALRVLKGEKKTGDVSVALVPPRVSSDLNLRYRNRRGPATVLTFPMEGGLLGEVVICPQAVRAFAKEYGIVAERAMELMVVHGTLHLLGAEHSSMKLKEQRYLYGA